MLWTLLTPLEVKVSIAENKILAILSKDKEQEINNCNEYKRWSVENA